MATLEVIYCKPCDSEQPVRSTDGRCARCYRNYQREYKRAPRHRCNICGCSFVKRNAKQGKRCRSCINKAQREGIKKRQKQPTATLTSLVLSHLWTSEGLGENWG